MRKMREIIAAGISDNTSKFFDTVKDTSDRIVQGTVNFFLTATEKTNVTNNLPSTTVYRFPTNPNHVIQRKYVDDLTIAIGAGNMLDTVYDPDFKKLNVYKMDNMEEGVNTKIMTSAERAKLVNVPTDTNSALATLTSEVDTLQANEFKEYIATAGTGELVYSNPTEIYRNMDTTSNSGPLYQKVFLKYPGRYRITFDVKTDSNTTVALRFGDLNLKYFSTAIVTQMSYYEGAQFVLGATGVYETKTFDTGYLDGSHTLYLIANAGGAYIKNFKIECTPVLGNKENRIIQ